MLFTFGLSADLEVSLISSALREKPVSYILSAFRMGAADISCVYRGVSLDCFCISCIRSSSRMYIVIVVAV